MKLLFLTFSLLLISVVTMAQTYPSSKGNNTTDEYISLVQIGSIYNLTDGTDTDGDGIAGYDNFTSQTAVLLNGSTYTLSVTIDAKANDYINAWVDWNDNGDFTDANESYVVVANTSSNGPHTVSITVPTSAAGKTVRLRVSLKWNAAASSTETFSYGEVEDYGIYVDKDSDADGVFDTNDKDDDNDGMLDEDENICINQDFLNGNFENNLVYPTSYIITNKSDITGWNTTASDNKIEIWKSGFNSVPAYEGTYFAEINANMSARMYQTLAVEPGDIVKWNVAHRGRGGVDSMYIMVGPTGAPTLQQIAATGTSGWNVYSSSYTVPSGVTEIEIGFESKYTASGDASVGNFIDDIQLYITKTYYCDYDGDGVANLLDLDSDNDGINDAIEGGGTDTDNNGIIGSGTFSDTDGDGLSNIVDPDNGGTALPLPDSDGDGKSNYLDIDSDKDGIVDNIEAQSTTGYLAPLNTDANSNGWDDRYDGNAGGTAIGGTDTDGDATPDYKDTNADNHGSNDLIEAYDTNNDGVSEKTAKNIDSDGDGLDNAFDVDGTSATDNDGPTNASQTANSFPNDDNENSPERDWREALSTLPISLISFEAQLMGDYVQLTWATASELNNDYFVIQRAMDQLNFTDIGQIKGNGNSNIILNYNYVDQDIPEGVLYYRFKQVDFDGTASFSSIEVVRTEAQKEMLIYPNPSHGIFTIETTQAVDVLIYSTSGQLIIRHHFEENTTHSIDLSGQTKGIYVMTFLSQDQTTTQRIIIE